MSIVDDQNRHLTIKVGTPLEEGLFDGWPEGILGMEGWADGFTDAEGGLENSVLGNPLADGWFEDWIDGLLLSVGLTLGFLDGMYDDDGFWEGWCDGCLLKLGVYDGWRDGMKDDEGRRVGWAEGFLDSLGLDVGCRYHKWCEKREWDETIHLFVCTCWVGSRLLAASSVPTSWVFWAQTNVKELTSPVGACVGSVEGDADGPLLGVCEGDRLGLVVGCKLNGVKWKIDVLKWVKTSSVIDRIQIQYWDCAYPLWWWHRRPLRRWYRGLLAWTSRGRLTWIRCWLGLCIL